jgi:6-phosphofructokinase 1
MKVHDLEFVGFRNGWRGVVDSDLLPLGRDEVKGISKQGGTILGTSRTNPFEGDGGVDRVNQVMSDAGIDAIIAIGGEGTLAAAKRLTDAGVKIVGVPKTVDNDLDATDYSFGFDTAVQIATDAMVHGRRSHGSPRRMDRPALRHGRGRTRHPHSRAQDLGRTDLQVGKRGPRPWARTPRRRR